jgi:predicted ATPase/class 3 adenylate cyclase
MTDVLKEQKALPTGTVTFLFTDIEGSTERWERHRDAMRSAVRRHEEVMREAMAAHDGHVFKTIGDAFCAAFYNVAAAIAAALDAQRSLAKQDWSAVDGLKVRMAIHTGHTDERDGDYFGPAVNRVARLLAIGHGGQVLVSGASADLAQGELPPQAALRDLGAHRLKDLTHPEQVYQLVVPDLPGEFPPLRSLEALPNNLPLQLTSFVGREVEILTITETLGKHRLITLVGAGGVGKTRLALQVGAELLDSYPDGVWLLEQAPISDGDLIPSALASLFQVREAEHRSITEAIVHSLKPRHALIIFDNCEHVVEAAARLIDTILRNCPQIRIIATTRQGLGIAGEAVHRVASLAVPTPSPDLTAEEAIRHGAVALFVERAIAATETFRLTDRNAYVVARLCQRLDGIALAIELAAPRLKALSVEQLEAKLSERFRILTGGSRTALPRQQTMRALVDWSYELLTDDERRLFRRLAVFGGGWTLDAATAICADETIEDWTILDLLQSLVDKSMVVAELSGSEQRYRLLESTRQYAHELLEKSGELEPMQTRHAAYFLDYARQVADRFWTTPTKAWIALLQPENDNLRGALDWALGEKRDVELGAALAGYVYRYWFLTAFEAEGRARIEAAIALSDEIKSKETIAALWLGRTYLSSLVIPWLEQRPIAQRALELNREVANAHGIVVALGEVAESHLRLSEHDEAERYLAEALAIAEKTGDRRLLGHVKARLARNLHFSGRTDEARRAYAEVVNIARAVGDDRMKNVVIGNLAEIEFNEGNAVRALELAQEIAYQPADRYITLNNMAAYLVYLGRLDEARTAAHDALRLTRSSQNEMHTAISILHLAAVAAGKGDLERAARLFGYSSNVFNAKNFTAEPTERQALEKMDALIRRELSDGQRDSLVKEGVAMSEDQAVEEAQRV